MREITEHRTNDANGQLTIEATDQPGSGGANHRYEITGFDTANNPSRLDPQGYALRFQRLIVMFQNGPIGEVGVNGVTHEALLAIVADRLHAFQAGPYACPENAAALAHVEEAQLALQTRTLARMARGVEGTHTV